MEITHQMIKEQIDDLGKGLEAYKQGYLMALSWAAAILDKKEDNGTPVKRIDQNISPKGE